MALISIIMWAAAIPGVAVALLVAWNVLAWPRVRGRAGREHRPVSILIPARNEEKNLEACLQSALSQGEVVAEVLVYDDHSSDKTAQIVIEASSRDERVRLLPTIPLPAGWCGKNFACFVLARAAKEEWILFLDADASLAAGAVERIAGEAHSRGATLLSCWPGLVLIGFWERTLLPLLNFVVFGMFPARLSLTRDDPSLGLAHGACLLSHRPTYLDIGGHELVRDQIFEDTRLARAWRERGHVSLCLDGQDVVRVRMYGSFSEIWFGFQKNFYPAFHRKSAFWCFLGFHVLLFIVPSAGLALAMSGHSSAVPALIAVIALLFSRLALTIRFGHPFGSILLHPAATAVMAAIGLTSWWKCRSGAGVEWKGRRYLRRDRSTADDNLAGAGTRRG